MSYQSRRMNSILILHIIIVLVWISPTQQRMCYVCGIGSQEPFTQDSKSKLEHPDMDIPLSCDEFDSSTILDKFIFTCPSNYVGCITQTDGTDVVRTCVELAINDCQTANGVEYCYCSTDLCNKKMEMKDITHYDEDDSSDIDEFESSGYSSIDQISYDKMQTTMSTSTVPEIESPSPVTELPKLTTIATTTEAITTHSIHTTNQNLTHTLATTTADSTNNSTSRHFICPTGIFTMQLLMLIFAVTMLP